MRSASHDGGTGADESGPPRQQGGGVPGRNAGRPLSQPREEVGGSPPSARGSCVQGARPSTTAPVTTCRVRGASGQAHAPAVASEPPWEPDRSLAYTDGGPGRDRATCPRPHRRAHPAVPRHRGGPSPFRGLGSSIRRCHPKTPRSAPKRWHAVQPPRTLLLPSCSFPQVPAPPARGRPPSPPASRILQL